MRNGLFLAGAVFVAGCVGAIGSGDPSGDGMNVPSEAGKNESAFTCDPSAVPDTLPLRRLSATQYKNALRDLLTELAPATAKTLLASIESKLASLPDDRQTAAGGETHGGFRRLDQVVNQEHVTVGYDVAVAIGRALAVQTIAGSCATDTNTSNDDACVDAFIRKVGALAHRRPVTDEDVAFYRTVAGSEKVSAAALGDVVAALLASPRSLYHVEHGTSDDAWSALDPYELAARLSFHFWQTSPDRELRTAAESGALLTDDGFIKEVHRLFADPRTEATLDDFVREWLWLDELPEMNGRVGDPIFDAFAGSDKPGPDLREHMIDDVLSSARSAARSGTFASFFLDGKSYATAGDLTKIYAGSEAARVGLITRPAIVASGSANTRPIMKGVFIRKALLCDEIPAPPNNAAANAPVLSPSMTTREVVEQLTERPGSACAGCHSTVINPLGFATENFDSLGRHRTAQKLFDATGTLVSEKPVDTHTVPRVTDTDTRESSGAPDVAKYLLESGKVQRCFARQWFRFTFARGENGRDGCALSELEAGARDGKSLAEVLMRIALSPQFKRRSF